jgi:hypothetical protein
MTEPRPSRYGRAPAIFPAARAPDAAARALHLDAVAAKVDHFKIATCP